MSSGGTGWLVAVGTTVARPWLLTGELEEEQGGDGEMARGRSRVCYTGEPVCSYPIHEDCSDAG